MAKKRVRRGKRYYKGDMVRRTTRRARLLDKQRDGSKYESWEARSHGKLKIGFMSSGLNVPTLNNPLSLSKKVKSVV